jgi:hypothetical protein
LTGRGICEALLTKARYRLLSGANTGWVGPDRPGGGSCATDCADHRASDAATAAAPAPPLLSLDPP